MDKDTDKKTRMALLESLARVKEYEEELRRRREKGLWKEISVPCSISEAIARLSRNELDKVRQTHDMKNISALRKKELAEKIAGILPAKAGKAFFLFDEERYRLAGRILANGGFILKNEIADEKIDYFKELCILFPGIKDGKKVLVMPLEILEVFRKTDGPVLQKAVRRNTEWIGLTHGLLHYYGVLNHNRLEGQLAKLTGQKPDMLKYIYVMIDSASYYGRISFHIRGLCDVRVLDADKVVKEQEERPGIDYYPFTKKQLLKAGEPGYIDKTPAVRGFTDFLLGHYEMTGEEAEDIVRECIKIINLDGRLGDLIEYLNGRLEFPSHDMARRLAAKLTDLYNNSRRWILKGHTPEEIFQEEKKHLNPLPPAPFVLNRPESNVVDIRTRSKVGRNELCPCGSGKKHKKCCGRR